MKLHPASLLLLLIFSLTSLSFQSCAVSKEKDQEQGQDITIIGRNCGMCRGTCFKGYQISGNSIQRIEAASSDKLETASLMAAGPDAEQKFKVLLSYLPSISWPENERIGCPDCHDQCGIYVYSLENGNKKTVLIDPDAGAYPKELEPFVSQAKALLWE